MDKPRLYLNPDCPRFATTPARADGSFDHEKFGRLLQMQERGGVTLEHFVKIMQDTEMEDTPLIRARESVLTGVEADGFETHPANWEAMPEEYRAMWEVAAGCQE